MEERLPPVVSSFLDTHIDSVEQLEALLLLREEKGRRWTADEVGDRLNRAPLSLEARLSALVDASLLERSREGYVYALRGEPHRLLAEVARCYRLRRTAVIQAIFAGDD